MPARRQGPIEQAVRRDLDADLLASPLGQATLAAAKRMDNAAADDRDFSTLYREFRQTMDLIAKQKPAPAQEDSLAKRRARREASRARG